MTVLLATNNTHKIREIQQIAPGITFRTPADLGITFSHEETGSSFTENALGKAAALHQALSALPAAVQNRITAVLADDSGICVDALDGRPGIHSARYGAEDPHNPPASDAERTARLLRELGDRRDRSARYICAVAVLRQTGQQICVTDTLEGRIATAPSSGTGGFGYDPVFFLPQFGCTAADISDEQKHAVSHRGKAVRQALAALQAAEETAPPRQSGSAPTAGTSTATPATD
ncbi:RdgB/HAM1 family non-canonical purine NTP pyrophosphatase [Spirochaeta africana]|uniref:dITP/XTP pyrophosphatase n=1 Tax=Spirochaeta africana (strain ATCC 700263 / DSM 8902 / Z-7692) TaxID=889378 RepID=H9UI74_SPIAZ|nr:RdgB/HAM1 family non-canonical purine NTP pyrophosphatase [Spirochaeta africana]AFG37217.1 non-canonical purine NTP pyrophosphatase, rdgB/HAM1 family [Spirochaeta africana DSM 8902]